VKWLMKITPRTLVRWNTPLVRAWYFNEAFQLFWV
jgi:hypothetical protein